MNLRDTLFMRFFALTKIPLLWFIRPTVVELNEEKCVVSIPFIRRNKNHLGSMYFGVLCAAADCAGGFFAMKLISESGERVSLSFKSFQADFMKRVYGKTIFINEQGKEIKALVEEAIKTKERVEMPVHIKAFVPELEGEEVVASFTLILSLKLKS